MRPGHCQAFTVHLSGIQQWCLSTNMDTGSTEKVKTKRCHMFSERHGQDFSDGAKILTIRFSFVGWGRLCEIYQMLKVKVFPQNERIQIWKWPDLMSGDGSSCMQTVFQTIHIFKIIAKIIIIIIIIIVGWLYYHLHADSIPDDPYFLQTFQREIIHQIINHRRSRALSIVLAIFIMMHSRTRSHFVYEEVCGKNISWAFKFPAICVKA